MTRREMLAATAGIAASAAITVLPGAAQAEDVQGLTVPAGKRGIQLFDVRDIITRTPNAATGVQGGFRFVFEQLAAMGYNQVEFAGYTQSTSILGRQITAAEIRQLLDDNGLLANGSHIGFSDATLENDLDIAETIGMPHLGTANIPTNGRTKADWEAAAVNFNRWGAQAAARGIKLYQHNHHAEYNFLLDSLDEAGNPTRSTGMRGLQYFINLVDPALVWFEMDIYWAYVAQHRYQTYTDPNGVTQTDIFDPPATVIPRAHRFPLFHVKDGVRSGSADGYDMVPVGNGDIPLHEFLNSIPEKGYHYPNVEQDNAPGPGNQSLDLSKVSLDNYSTWRG
ncbi:MAG: sugar phosphate isomerase/epimerase [Micromonosporaceae bacterium]|nr:sugar phosphate isomerase/epimerase [Micromonosporaceae bacterium]